MHRKILDWKRAHGHEYLYRERSTEWKSIGARPEETERVFAQFREGRSAIKHR